MSEGEQKVHLQAYCLAIARKLVIEQTRERKKQQSVRLDPGWTGSAIFNPDRE